MPKLPIHVVPHDKKWAVKQEGSERLLWVTDTKKEAMEIGRQRAKESQTELVTHGQDGRIQDKDSHGRDPCPPKDRRP